MLAELSIFGPLKSLLKSKSSQYCVIWHRFTVSLPVLPFCGTDKSIEPERSNNNLSVAVIQLISCAPPAMSIIGSFIWTKLRPGPAKSVVLCASSAIRIQWRNLRSIYHTWESQKLPATCIRKPMDAKFTPHLRLHCTLTGSLGQFVKYVSPLFTIGGMVWWTQYGGELLCQFMFSDLASKFQTWSYLNDLCSSLTLE